MREVSPYPIQWVQDRIGYFWDEDEVNRRLELIMNRSFKVWNLDWYRTMRVGAFILAIKRIVEVIQMAGLRVDVAGARAAAPDETQERRCFAIGIHPHIFAGPALFLTLPEAAHTWMSNRIRDRPRACSAADTESARPSRPLPV
jgi:hypothetical protein